MSDRKLGSVVLRTQAPWFLIGIALLAIAIISVYLTVRSTEDSLERLQETQKLRITTAFVRGKEYVRLDEQHNSYVNDLGKTVIVPHGSEQWRIYYQIDNFDQVLGPKRNQLWESEEARIKKFGFRFCSPPTVDMSFYRKAQIGDKLEVQYRYEGIEKEIIRVRNLTHQ